MKIKALSLTVMCALILGACGGSKDNTVAGSSKMLAQSAVVNGLSSAFFESKRANYTVTVSGDTVTVVDTVGSEGTTTLSGVKRLYFSDSALAYDVDGTAGQVYRLYKAAFNRQPDSVGLGFQISAAELSGAPMLDLAKNFAASDEYLQRYGNTTNTQFVTLLYQNALHRDPEDAGLAFHVSYLDQGKTTRAALLYGFSESAENKSQVAGEVANGISFTAYNVSAPTTVPGAPTLTSVVAGNAKITLAFSAPSSNGGSTITSYTATCSTQAGTKTASGTASPITVSSLSNGTAYSCSVKATNSVGTGTASSTLSATPSSTATLTGHLFCPYSASVFNSTLNLTSTVDMSCNSTTRVMSANGVPDHVTGAFPNANNPSTISAQSVHFGTSLNPAVTSTTGTAVSHIVGFANNGIKFDPATAETYQSAGKWNIEALGQTYVLLGTDSSNAHVQPDGSYHYHGMPEGYITKLAKNPTAQMTLVGFANDGFPMYARYGYTTATSATSTIKVMTSSYRLKTSPDSGRPSTTTVPMGVFTQDYEYVAGLGDLDECNGRFGVTPEFPAGIYHYYITDSYPYIQRCIKGTALTGP